MEVILWQKHIKEKNIICDKCKCEEMEIMERLKEYNGLSTLFCTTFIRSYLQDDILPESCIPKYCEYVYNCTIKHNFSTLYSTLLSF